MQELIKKLKNVWYYYKVYVLIGAAVLAVAVYLTYQDAAVPEKDYHIGMISTGPWSDRDIAELEDRLAAAGQDVNGDGQVLVQVHLYRMDLADDSPNAGVNNYETVAALDADLVGKLSGIFLTEDPQSLQRVTAGLLEEPFVPFDAELYLALRREADGIYRQLLDALN